MDEPSTANRMLVLLLTVQLDSGPPSKVDLEQILTNSFPPFNKIWTRRQHSLKSDDICWSRHLACLQEKSMYWLNWTRKIPMVRVKKQTLNLDRSKVNNYFSLQFKRVQERHEVKLVWTDFSVKWIHYKVTPCEATPFKEKIWKFSKNPKNPKSTNK